MSWLDTVREDRSRPAAVTDPFDAARYTPGLGLGYARAALEAEAQRVLSATEGTRNHTLNRAAFCLGQLVAGGELDEAAVTAELTSAAQLAGLDDREITPTIASGLRNGALHPRTAPEPNAQVSSTFITPMGVNGGDGATHPGDGTDTPVTPGGSDTGAPGGEPMFLEKLRGALIDTHGLDHIPEPTPLVKGVLYMDSLAWLQGKPGNGKSFIALDLAGCVGSGQNWQGFGTPTRSTVLYLVAEGVSGVRQRVRAWEQAMGHPMDNVLFLPVAVQAANEPEWAALVALTAELEPALVVVDTQARVTVGMEENAAKDMGLFVHRLEQVRVASRACVLVVHHQGRAGEHMRGSTAMEGAATTIISVAKEDDVLTIVNQKQKDAPPFDDFKLRLKSFGPSAIVTPIDLEEVDLSRRPAVQNMIHKWWGLHGGDPVSASLLVKSGVCADTTFWANKKLLENQGVIAAEGTGRNIRYRLVRPPDEALTPTPPSIPPSPGGGQDIDDSFSPPTPTTPLGVGVMGVKETCPPLMDLENNPTWNLINELLGGAKDWVARNVLIEDVQRAGHRGVAELVDEAARAGRLEHRITEKPYGPYREVRLPTAGRDEPPCGHDPGDCPPVSAVPDTQPTTEGN